MLHLAIFPSSIDYYSQINYISWYIKNEYITLLAIRLIGSSIGSNALNIKKYEAILFERIEFN